MNKNLLFLVLIYYCAISAVSILITIYDKIAAKRHRRRIPESVLLTFAFFGGAMPMYLTMKLIHHKTRYSQFMVGLPAMIITHLLLILGAGFMLTR